MKDFILPNILAQQPSLTHSQVPKHMFLTTPHTGRRYPELDLFRQHIEENKENRHHQLYTLSRKHVVIYKSIFFIFAAFFACLGIGIFVIPTAMACGFFSSCTLIKTVLATLCGLFSTSALIIACTMRTEREAVLYCVKKARKLASQAYARKRIRMGISRFFAFFGNQRQQLITLRQMYHDICDRINHKKEETLHLMTRIAASKVLDTKERETLFNQAAEELYEKLMMLTHNLTKTNS